MIVEQTIVDRLGVPPALYDKYWVAAGQVGQVGTTARMVMPSNEGVLGADAGRVASIPFDSNFEPIVGPNGVTITVRDLRSGATLRTFDTEVLVLEGLMTGSLLFWIGRAIPLEGPDLIDGGIWVIDLADPASEPRAIIPPADLTGTFGPHASRGLLRLTDRGRALITLVQSDTTRATDVIDVANLTVRQTLEGVFAVEVLGGLAVVSPIHGDGADPEHPNRLRLIDIATGIEIGSGVRTDQVKATSLGEGEVFAQYGRDNTDSIIIAMDLETGEIREIRVQLGGSETLDLSHVLSAPGELVLLSVNGPELDSNGRVQLPMTLLDPVTGVLQRDAFTVGSP